MEFHPHSKKKDDKTSVWFYFLQSTDSSSAKCKTCSRIIKCTGGSTSSLHTHLKSAHSLKVATSQVESGSRMFSTDSSTSLSSPSGSGPVETSTKKRKISDFFSSNYDMDNMICRMVALDGMSFQLFIRSDDMRYLFLKSGHTLPKSASTIKNIVMKKGSSLRDHIKNMLLEMKENEEKFGLTLDEWTSSRNHRYLNVNIHASFKDNTLFKNLGLVRIVGCMPASACIEALQNLIMIYGLSFNDIVAITTDGASVMVKVGKDLPCFHQLCFAHGLQLAILDVFFNEKKSALIPQEMQNPETENDCFEISLISSDESTHHLTESIKDLILKVRKTVKLFKKSPTKNDSVLQKYVIEEHGKEMALVLDCNTRWSSMANMLDRFVQLKGCILKSLIDLNSEITFLDEEFEILTDMSTCLQIAKITVEALCRRDANLITADVAINFILTKLKQHKGRFSANFTDRLTYRIKQRCTSLTSALKYLQNPSDYYTNRDKSLTTPSLDRQQIAEVISKLQILGQSEILTSSRKRPNSDDDDDVILASIASTSSTTHTKMTMKEELQAAIEKTMSESDPKLSRRSVIVDSNLEIENNLTDIVRVEMALYENGGVKGKNLLQVYSNLLKVPPTSVESERVFSSAGYLCNHLRTSLNDDTLDMLSMLRSYHQVIKSKKTG